MNKMFAPLAAFAAAQVRGRVNRLRGMAIGYAVACLGTIGLIATGFVSLHRYLSMLWTPFQADLALGGVFALIIVIGLVVASSVEPQPQTGEAAKEAMKAATMSAAPIALNLLRGRKNGTIGLLSLGVAIAVGIFAVRGTKR
jgi:hypothetical protein